MDLAGSLTARLDTARRSKESRRNSDEGQSSRCQPESVFSCLPGCLSTLVASCQRCVRYARHRVEEGLTWLPWAINCRYKTYKWPENWAMCRFPIPRSKKATFFSSLQQESYHYRVCHGIRRVSRPSSKTAATAALPLAVAHDAPRPGSNFTTATPYDDEVEELRYLGGIPWWMLSVSDLVDDGVPGSISAGAVRVRQCY